MSVSMEISGQQAMAALSRALKQAGQGQLRREWVRDIKKATASAKHLVPDSARAVLPHRGGLNTEIANQLEVKTSVSLSGNEARVRVYATTPQRPKRRLRDYDHGQIRKPVYGDREVWRPQAITPGMFTKPMVSLAPAAQRGIADATNRVLAAIARATL